MRLSNIGVAYSLWWNSQFFMVTSTLFLLSWEDVSNLLQTISLRMLGAITTWSGVNRLSVEKYFNCILQAWCPVVGQRHGCAIHSDFKWPRWRHTEASIAFPSRLPRSNLHLQQCAESLAEYRAFRQAAKQLWQFFVDAWFVVWQCSYLQTWVIVCNIAEYD